MSNNDYVVAFVVATMAVFVLSLVWVTWWTNQKPKTARLAAPDRVPERAHHHGEMTTH